SSSSSDQLMGPSRRGRSSGPIAPRGGEGEVALAVVRDDGYHWSINLGWTGERRGLSPPGQARPLVGTRQAKRDGTLAWSLPPNSARARNPRARLDFCKWGARPARGERLCGPKER